MLRNLMSSGSILPFILFNKPGEGMPAAGGAAAAGQSDPPANGDTTPAGDDGAGDQPAGEGDGDAGGDDGAGGAVSGDAGGDDGDASGDAAPAAGAAAAIPDWRDREIGRKHRQLQDERREKERLSRELEDARALLARQPGGNTDDIGDGAATTIRQPAAPLTPDAVQREARRIVAQQTYNQQCNAVYEAGGKEYKDKWDGALERLQMLGGFGADQEGVETMTSVLAADNPAQVMYTLGSNPDEYHRVMALPPAKRMAEIVKLGMTKPVKPTPKPAAGDPPIEPLTRRAAASDPDPQDNDDDATWYAKRKRQKDARWAAKQQGARV